MNEARKLDPHNIKHMLSNDQIEKTEQKIGLFTMICIIFINEFVLEEGESYIRQKK
ncbi:hypothetical protein C2G38_2173544 [Gigaspora rosea]|uniref:Uncharacterized protein n=1 Tax=Gigaspora rosea TaxID=44941 RepID=A0A397VUC9_9GLOM|nr:hypothetical protein C2G38_2173544 [Gigaspora rosea]